MITRERKAREAAERLLTEVLAQAAEDQARAAEERKQLLAERAEWAAERKQLLNTLERLVDRFC